MKKYKTIQKVSLVPKGDRRKGRLAASLLILCLAVACFSLGGSIVYVMAPPAISSTFYLEQGVYPGAPSYTVWREGFTYYAKDANGHIPTWGMSGNASGLINLAIDDIGTNGGVLRLMGTNSSYYALDSSILVGHNTDGLEIVGDGFSTQLRMENGAETNMFVIGDNVTRLKISNLRLMGNWDNNAAGHAIVLGDDLDHSLLENLYIAEFDDRGISYAGTVGVGGVTIRRVIINKVGENAIYLRNAHSTTVIEDCILGNAVEAGNPYISNAVVYLYLCRGVTVVNTGVFCGQYGINVYGGRNNKFNQVYLHYNRQYGIWFQEGSTAAIVTDCICYSNGQQTGVDSVGIQITNSHNITVSSCQALNNLGWTSDFTDNSQDYGIRETGTSNNNLITGNIARGNILLQIAAAVGANTRITNNMLNGFPQENGGTATGTSSIVVAHGCAGTLDYVTLAVMQNDTNHYTTSWLNINATHFRIYHNHTSSITVAWYGVYVP